MPRNNSTAWNIADPITAARLNQINLDLDDIYSKGNDRLKVWAGTGLNINIGSGNYRVGITEGQYAGGTATVTNNATNYVMINSSGIIVVNTTGWIDDNVKLATVVASGGNISSVNIWKSDVVGGPLSETEKTIYSVTVSENVSAGDAIGYVLEDYIYKNNNKFNAANTTNIQAVLIETNKILIAYTDVGNSNKGTCIVATISSDTISYGSEYVFNNAGTDSIGIDLINTDKIVFAFRNTSNGYIMAVVGTVSGTVMTFGSTQTIDAQNCNGGCQPVKISNDYFFLSYAGYFGRGNGILATVSGTVMTFGSMVQYINDNAVGTGKPAVLSSTSILIPYSYGGASYAGYCKIATISGTTISSYGTAYQFTTSNAGNMTTRTLSSTSVLLSFRDGAVSNKGTSIIASISGTVVSYGSKYAFSSGAASYISITTFGSNYFLFYKDEANSNYITAISASISGTVVSYGSTNFVDAKNIVFLFVVNNGTDYFVSYNLTSDTHGYSEIFKKEFGYFKTNASNINRINFVGFSAKTVASGNSCKIHTSGINKNQSGMTIGQTYYLSNTAGQISSTPGTNIVPIGFSLSATDIDIFNQIGLKSQGLLTPTVGASPYTYQNITGKQAILSITGGTVSQIAISRDNTNYYQTATATNSFVILGLNDYVKITYSGTPTIKIFTF